MRKGQVWQVHIFYVFYSSNSGQIYSHIGTWKVWTNQYNESEYENHILSHFDHLFTFHTGHSSYSSNSAVSFSFTQQVSPLGTHYNTDMYLYQYTLTLCFSHRVPAVSLSFTQQVSPSDSGNIIDTYIGYHITVISPTFHMGYPS